MNTIEIDLKSLPKDIRKWVEYEITLSNAHDIPVKLLSKRHVMMDGTRCNGYFCSEKPELVVACYKDFNEWLPILVHESCHRDQYTEKAAIWSTLILIDGVKEDPLNLLWDWLAGKIELKPRQVTAVTRAVMYLELDCEIRSAKKIDEFYLPINTKEYIQKANAYAYMYLTLQYTRLWYPKGKAPFYLADVWTKMPTDFDRDYDRIPSKIKNLILQKCYGKKA
jgi:hypothetical protein